MKKTYIAGDYFIKSKNRGVIKVRLTAGEAKSLFSIFNKINHEWESVGLWETYIN